MTIFIFIKEGETMANNGCRCAHKDMFMNEKTTCFAYRNGACDALQEPCRYASGRCKFFKSLDTYIAELKATASKLDYNFEDYLRACGLQWVIAILKK